ncbi:N-hydroxyarylamine O-acetyltransferase, partial [Shigella dysenteriae]
TSKARIIHQIQLIRGITHWRYGGNYRADIGHVVE